MSNLTASFSTRAVPDWRAAVWAGLIAGAVFMMLEMLLVSFFMNESPWAPPRMIAAIVLGQGVLPPPAPFDFMVLMVAMVIHFILSVAYGLIFAWVAYRWTWGTALIAGAIFGIALYLINFYGFTLVFPWFAMARNWISILSHLMFGIVLAGIYKGFEKGASPLRP